MLVTHSLLATARSRRRNRRGVVLVLILAMLGLMAVLGVTFATFSGQTQVSGRYYAQAANEIDIDRIVSFGIDQLINDTDNPVSALRGHSLSRDMYGDDARDFGAFATLPDGRPMILTQVALNAGVFRVTTNIPWDSYALPQLYGRRFFDTITNQGWFLRLELWAYNNGFPVQQVLPPVAATFQIVSDLNLGGFHAFDLTAPDSGNGALIVRPDQLGANPLGTANRRLHLKLDNDYRNAFNGTGMSTTSFPLDPTDPNSYREPGGVFGNFRVNGPLQGTGFVTGNPAAIGMDEDYDAADLDNWFLALRSADGSVMIPSFHRPSVLRYAQNATGTVLLDDWTDTDLVHTTDPQRLWKTKARILRPRAVDGHDAETFAPLRPAVDGTIRRDLDGDGLGDAAIALEFDVDNDGDGRGDSVWLDLGFPIQYDASGRAFKPLFAFMVEGLNGKIPLNTAGNLANRELVDNPATTGYNEIGTPTFTHASHLGTTPSEINPGYVLQAPFDSSDVTYDPSIGDVTLLGQFDSAGVSASVTQTRNLLAGTRPQEFSSGTALNQDANIVVNVPLNNRSPNESYLPNNVLDAQDNGFDRSRVNPIPGRWGEPGGVPADTRGRDYLGQVIVDTTGTPVPGIYNNPVGPGRSIYLTRVDGFDDDYNGIDFYPLPAVAAEETANFVDPAGALALPSERYRYAVTPFDLFGIGRVINYDGIKIDGDGMTTPDRYNSLDFALSRDFFRSGYGPDSRGRVTYLNYFRPPGLLPLIESVLDQRAIIRDGMGNIAATSSYNLTHGHEAHRTPDGRFGAFSGAAAYNIDTGQGLDGNGNLIPPRVGPTFRYLPASIQILSQYMPNAFPVLAESAPMANDVPTYPTNSAVYNSYWVPGSDTSVVGPVPVGSPAVNDSSEMELDRYVPAQNDQPFTWAELAQLYARPLDPNTRWSKLAPVSFANLVNLETDLLYANAVGTDGDMRSRMVTTDAWDLTSPSFGVTTTTHVNADGMGNPIYPGVTVDFRRAVDNRTGISFRPVRWDTTTGAVQTFIPTNQASPSLQHRDRRINLNFPLPVSNAHDEPLRQKWIRETYEFCKQILPPAALDTPEELAELSQYLVNIIDFRDPDGAVTRFVNTDIITTPAGDDTDGNPMTPPVPNATPNDLTDDQLATLTIRNAATQPLPASKVPFDTTLVPADNYLIQYGMEYNPVALNEVLAFAYNRHVGGNNVLTPRFYVELINTISNDGHEVRDAANNLIREVDSANLNLGQNDLAIPDPDNPLSTLGTLKSLGYDMVMVEEGATGRPDPFTGQVPNGMPSARNVWKIEYDSAATQQFLDGLTRGAGSSNYFYVFSFENPDPNSEHFPPAMSNRPPKFDSPSVSKVAGTVVDNFFPPRDSIGNEILATDNKFFWLYLRRPANPDLPIQEDPALADYNPAVVVDSIRFPYTTSGGTGTVTMSGVDVGTAPTRELYSIQRLQPYRGGQAVPRLPLPPVGTTPELDLRYGLSQQTTTIDQNITMSYPDPRNPDVNEHYGWFTTDTGVPTNPATRIASTGQIGSSLGRDNSYGGTNVDSQWDFFPFHDRDFQSVAELLLVPGCPPGLFTKRFVEFAPDSDNDLTTPPIANYFIEYDPGQIDDLVTPPSLKPNDNVTASAGSPPRRRAIVGQSFDNGTQAEMSPPDMTNTNAIPPVPRVYPYLVDKFFYNSYLDGAAYKDAGSADIPPAAPGDGDGWHTLLEFFEVPSTQIGAIGLAATGHNADWLRQDLRPGQLNLNLIIDEEAFFGLIDDPRLSTATAGAPPNITQGITAADNPVTAALNGTLNVRAMANRGFAVLPPYSAIPGIVNGQMHAAFADFLRLTHGGNNLYTFGPGYRPYRSLSFPDINGTIMRPASLLDSPPVGIGTGMFAVSSGWRNTNPNMRYAGAPVQAAPGDAAGTVLPQNPPRRLFQVLDVDPISNAGQSPLGIVPDHNTVLGLGLTNPVANLVLPAFATGQPIPNDFVSAALGGNVPPNWIPGNGSLRDTRQHPYFRTEWLQKMLNLTTVRTHQYAVWVTVGFFEVKTVGNPQLAPDPGQYTSAYDILGPEITTIPRVKKFFVIDRTRAPGFNPGSPIDYRRLIVHGL